uniref:Zinc finger protein 511 n=1 Tax=Oreochromis niloticus TaxID=8128 RepID=I3JT71_ORENI
MLQPEVVQLRTEGRDEQQERRLSESEEGNNPFSFTPQIIRLHKDHELFEDGDIHRHMYLQDLYISEAEDKPALSVSEFACHISGCSAVFSALEEYEHHYNALHRHVCCSCRRSLPSARLLDIHIQEWHDSLFTILAQKQDMYQCLVEGCGQKFRTSKHRKDHLIRIHKYPPDFRFDKTKKERGRETKRKEQKDAAMEMVDDVCESEGVCEVMCNSPSDEPEGGESMETHEILYKLNMCKVLTTVHVYYTVLFSLRIPNTVCFGHGSVRGFGGRRGRRK